MKSLREADFTDHNVQKILAEAEGNNIGWMSADSSRHAIMDRLVNPRQFTGFKAPWAKAEDKLRFREGELSVMGGYNGHRKSTLASQIALGVAQEAPVGICSLEEPLDDVGTRFIRQAACTDSPTIDYADDFVTWTDERIAIWDRLDTVAPAVALAAVYHMIAVIGCRFVILDSLMMCDVCDDIERERRFVASLTALAKLHNAHIMLIHHMRKPQDESRVPGKYDLLGAGHISNMASTILVSWEDKDLREKREFGEGEVDKPDHLFIVAKQRYGAFEGAISLWRQAGMNYSGLSKNECRPIDVGRLAA